MKKNIYINKQVWGSRKRIKFIAEKQHYACWEIQLRVATVYL